MTTGLRTGAKSITGFASSIGGLATKLAPLGAAIGGIAGAVKGITEVSQAFGEIDRIAKFSAQTGIATEELVGLEHAANLSGVSLNDLQRAQQRALREGFAGGVADIADKMAALESPTEKAQLAYEALGRSGQNLIPLLQQGGDAIRDMVSEGQQLAGFSGADAAKIEAANDAIARMKLSFTGIARDIAIGLAPVVESVAAGVKNVGIVGRRVFNNWLPVIKAAGGALSALFMNASPLGIVFQKVGDIGASVFAGVRDFLLDAALTAEFAYSNIGDVATLAWERTKLGAVSLWNDLHHLFTAQIPGVLTWFADNWQDIFFTAGDYALTVLINLGENIRSVWQGVLDFISGKGFNVDFTPLTEGFVSTVKEMPQIADREIGALESELMASVDRLSGNLAEGLGQHLTARREELLGPAEEAGKALAGGFGDGLGDAVSKGPGELAGVGALQRGSSEAFSAILGAMRGGTRDPAAESLKVQKEMLAEQKASNRELRKQSKGTTVELVAGTV